MMTDITRTTLLVFCEHLGVPLRDVLAREEWFERLVERLIAAGGDPFDVITPDTSDRDRTLIFRAAALLRRTVVPEPSEVE